MPRSIRLPIAIALLTLATIAGSPASADDAKVCYNQKSAPDDTIKACSRLLQSKKLTGSNRSNTLSWRANAYLLKGDLDPALKDTDDMIRLTPASHLAFSLRAQVWLRKSDLERAKRDSEDAVRLDPKVADYHNLYGFALHQLGQYDQAIAEYDRAIKLNPKQAAYFSNRGNSWQAKGDYARAIADQTEAMRIDPANAIFPNSRANGYREMGDFDRAMADYDQSTKMNSKTASPFAGRGMIWRARGDFDRAIAEFDQAIARDSSSLTIHVGRGLAHESRGNIEAAKRDFAHALTMKLTGQAQGAASGVMYIGGERYRSIAEARLKVLETAAATPVPAPQAPALTSVKERRIALVIGNGAYVSSSKLANPANDAAVVAKNLRDIGFEVSEGINLDAKKMKDTINGFLRGASTASMAVMFYAGHGMQVDGKNYLVPIDAKLDSAASLASDLNDVDTILAGLDDQIRTNIVILDACRDNPTLQKPELTVASRSVRSGLAPQSGLGAGATIGAGTLVAFATAPGQVALDGDGANSPFSAALARHIATPGLEVQQMLTRVRAEVVAATKNKQVPWSNSSLLGEVFLVGSR